MFINPIRRRSSDLSIRARSSGVQLNVLVNTCQQNITCLSLLVGTTVVSDNTDCLLLLQTKSAHIPFTTFFSYFQNSHCYGSNGRSMIKMQSRDKMPLYFKTITAE